MSCMHTAQRRSLPSRSLTTSPGQCCLFMSLHPSCDSPLHTSFIRSLTPSFTLTSPLHYPFSLSTLTLLFTAGFQTNPRKALYHSGACPLSRSPPSPLPRQAATAESLKTKCVCVRWILLVHLCFSCMCISPFYPFPPTPLFCSFALFLCQTRQTK